MIQADIKSHSHVCHRIGSIPVIAMFEPQPYISSFASSTNVTLSASEITHFKQQGFIVKRGLVSEQTVFDQIIDYVWETVPDGVMARDDQASWLDSPHERWPRERATEIGVLGGTNWKMRSKHRIGREQLLRDCTANHPKVLEVAAQFIGHSVMQSLRVRGVYVILPKPIGAEGRLGPHVDHAAAHLSAMVLIDHIEPKSGGFTVWPGSHERLHPYFMGCQHAHFVKERKGYFQQEFAKILSDTVPVEFVGEPGDVVFWHPRLIHSAGVNYSAETNTPRIRYAIPCDFQKGGRILYDDDDLGPGTTHQWWVDTRHYRGDPIPTKDNLWTDWEI